MRPQTAMINARGFTLIEVLLAMSLTAVIGVLAYQGLNSAIAAMDSQQDETRRIMDLQTAWRVIGNDLQQAAYRDITDEDEEIRRSFLAGSDEKEQLMEFTRSGWLNPLGQRRSELQRVRYIFENRQLWREHWLVLDRLKEPEPVRLLLLDNIETVKCQFFIARDGKPEGGEWLDKWPDNAPGNNTDTITDRQIEQFTGENNPGQAQAAQSALPLAVRIRIETGNQGTLERLFLLPDSDE